MLLPLCNTIPTHHLVVHTSSLTHSPGPDQASLAHYLPAFILHELTFCCLLISVSTGSFMKARAPSSPLHPQSTGQQWGPRDRCWKTLDLLAKVTIVQHAEQEHIYSLKWTYHLPVACHLPWTKFVKRNYKSTCPLSTASSMQWTILPRNWWACSLSKRMLCYWNSQYKLFIRATNIISSKALLNLLHSLPWCPANWSHHWICATEKPLAG